ncbi:hypothetical protein ABT224_20050 [Streptomyces sp. NPDC001584]|uniref:hypothetical protein n=1 Tax=Streptomyces sp. NPDC001584 TaxID=3154521 RepID=UPI003327D950
MSRRKPRSPGVSLGNRAAGYHFYGGGQRSQRRYLHHRVRGRGKAALRRLILDATGTAR